jgi:phospholipid/cholesterol/gamma-HCH transport system substrate-binding protein
MRLRNKDKNNFVKVGIFITALTIILMIMVVSIGKENSIFEGKIELKARLNNVSNLKPGSYVELRGIRIGAVKEINIISEEEVEVLLTVLESQLQWIKKDARVSISTAGLVGDKFLEIYSGSKTAAAFNPEEDVLTSESHADIKKIMNKGESIANITERILVRLDQILYNMDEGKKIVDSMNSIHKSTYNIEKITQALLDSNISGAVNNVNMSMARLDKASASIEKIMTRIEVGPGTMHSLVFDDVLHDDLRALLGGAQRNKVIKYFIRESIKNSERKKSQAED